jgi:hypothetical protein
VKDKCRAADYTLVDEDHQALYCFVPKIGCSTWKKALLQMSNHLAGRDSMEGDINSLGYLAKH